MKKEKNIKILSKLFENDKHFMKSFRKNLDICMDETGLTMNEVAELADMPYGTLNNLLYGSSENCNLSTAVRLAKVFGLSVDELVGCDSINPITRESLSICRRLPEHSLYLIRYFIRHQEKIYQKHDAHKKVISVLKPQCVRGNLLTTNVVEPLSIDHLSDNVKSAIYLGIRIPCEHYMPYYAPNDTLLVAADRKGINGERCVITLRDEILIVTKQSFIADGRKEWKYVMIMNDDIVIPEEDIDSKIGYIAGFLNPDGSWGSR